MRKRILGLEMLFEKKETLSGCILGEEGTWPGDII
jgi:hypothetical protein